MSDAKQLRSNLKMVVDTVRAIKESIAEAEADTKFDKTGVIKQLKLNQEHIIKWGKVLQEKIRIVETGTFTSTAV